LSRKKRRAERKESFLGNEKKRGKMFSSELKKKISQRSAKRKE